MNTQNQTKAPQPTFAAGEEYTPHTRLTGAAFVTTAPFGDERQSVQVGTTCDALTPARLEPDGTAVAITSGQRADGLLIHRKVHNLGNHQRFVTQCFVPWSNIRGLTYGPQLPIASKG